MTPESRSLIWNTRTLAAALLLVFGALVAGTAVRLAGPPPPVPADAPPTEFSAERAAAHVAVIAAEPHSAGSAAHARVREYLLARLHDLGLEPQVQTATGVTPRYAAAGSVANIVARIPGTSPGLAVALATHYDSAPMAPGAGDAAVAVAAILEAVRALRAGPPLRNDLIVLFTDGEEDGLIGASAFMEEHPWAREIGLVLNFEGRGNRGPALMFETSPGNAWLIDEFAAVAPHPRATSLSFELYRRLPNDTDFTIFSRHGLPGLNFAHVDGWAAYHTPRDTPAALDRATLQHHGATALALARHFGQRPLGATRTRDAVYFDLAGLGLLHYAETWVPPLIGLAAAALLGAYLLTGKSRRPKVTGLLTGVVAVLASVALTAGAVIAAWYGLRGLHRNWLGEGDIARSGLYLAGLLALAAGVHAALYGLLRRKLSAESLGLGALLIWLVLGVVVSGLLPGGSYVFTYPLLVGIVSAVVGSRAAVENSVTRGGFLALGVLMVPTVWLLAPLTHQLAVLLGLTRVGTPVVGVVASAALWLLVPQLEAVERARPRLAAVAAFAVAVALLAAGAATVRYSPHAPRPNALVYAIESGTVEAYWLSSADKPDPWTAQFLGPAPERGPMPTIFLDRPNAPVLKHEAPAVELPAPEVELLENQATGESRTLRLRARSPRGGRWLTLHLPDVEVIAATVNGRRVAHDPAARRRPASGWLLTYANLPPEGIEVQLEVRGTGPLTLRTTDVSLGLPQVPGVSYDPRDATMMPVHAGDATLVARTFRL